MSLRSVLPLVLAPFIVSCVAGVDSTEHPANEGDELKVCPVAGAVEGIDVSEFQGNINWGQVRASGREFAVIRVSDGVQHFDPKFNQNWANAKAAGVTRGAYQFFRASQDGTAQANFLLQHLGNDIGELAPVADVEVTDGVGPGTLNTHLAQWIDRIRTATGKTPIIYTSSGLWGSLSGSSQFSNDTLWVANWGVSCPSMPSPWTTFKFWQYADNGSVPGISGAVDLDRFNGTLAQLKAGGSSSSGGSAPAVVEVAFQANTGDLWTVGNAGNQDWKLGMMKGTSPSIAALPGGGFEVAFQANTGDLWTVGNAGNTDWKLGMMAGTSPSITALPGGGFEVAFQANTGDLWTVGSAGNTDWKLGMMAGSSPSITTLSNGSFQVAFEANTTSLWTVGGAGNKDWGLGMMSGTSPSITALPGGGFEVAFQANTGNLWTVGNAGNQDWKLGMMTGTNPSITALTGGGFEVAFQANTTSLWTVGNGGNKDWGLGMMKGTSPAIAPMTDGSFQVNFQANTGSLWGAGSQGTGPLNLGMMGGTSPSGT